MKQNKWLDFLFTITIRFVVGIVLGALACFLFTWKGILRAFSHDHTHEPLIWLGLFGLVGGIIAVFTVPRWQTPWYRRDSERPHFMADLEFPDPDETQFGSGVVKKSFIIKTVGKDGEQHQYSSMENAPPEIRSEIEALEREAAREKGDELCVTETSQVDNVVTSKIIHRKNTCVYKAIDDSGGERIYHSLEEMPAALRAAFAEAESKSKS